VTADDFVFAWRRLIDPKTASTYAYFIFLIKNAEAINSGKLPLTELAARRWTHAPFRWSWCIPRPICWKC